MMDTTKISVIGGGNIGTQFACVSASKGYWVTVLSSSPDKYSGELQIVDEFGTVSCCGSLHTVTDQLSEAMKSEVIFVTYPAFMFSSLAASMEPYIRPGMYICVLPGTGGAEFAFSGCIKKGAVLCGLQRVPAVARLVEYGKKVCVEGKRDCLHVASIPGYYASGFSSFLSELFDMPCVALKNYLSVTMTPSNPILHTTRLATMFADYEPGMVYPRNPLFYGEWSLASAERLIACDAEHQQILRKLDHIDLSDVKSLIIHYDHSDTPEKMMKKLRSISSLHKLSSPMKEVEGGWIPDFSSRYFTADFPYGLAIIEELGGIVGVEIPNIKKTMKWYRKVTGDQSKLNLASYGISTVDDINKLYLDEGNGADLTKSKKD